MIPVRQQPTCQRTAQTVSLQAPTGGLNARDPLSSMKSSEAITLENWFPTPSSVDIRNGYTSWATGLPDVVQTLAAFNSGSSQKLFAAAGSGVYDVTASGAVGAAVVSGLGSVRFQTINMSNSGGHWLMMVNGTDKLTGYSGSAWWKDGDGTHDITGIDTSTCININSFKHRIWLIKQNTFEAWYLGTDAISGAATKFDLGPIFKMGGSLVAMFNWTINASTGIDDYAAFITTEGEVALYQGTDPASADTWALVGTFRIGQPVGNRFYCKAGADVILLTTDGAFQLSQALLTDRSQLSIAVSDKIVTTLNNEVTLYKDNFGWQPIIYPNGNKLIINVPKVTNADAHQYVMNTINGSWCKFTGWNAFCWETLENSIYFGGDRAVYQADTGQDDNGSNINSIAQQSFNYFGASGVEKKWTMVRPVFISDGAVNPAVVMNVDFAETRTAIAPSFTPNNGVDWNVGAWDVSDWATPSSVYKKWIGVSSIGYAGGIRLVTAVKNLSCRWSSTDFVYEVGGVL